MHHFDEKIAVQFGVLEAILVNNIGWWIKKNEANGVHQYEGNTWTYNSIKAFCKLFPYATEKQLRRALSHLIDEGVLLTGNFNASNYDRTLWYAIAPEWKSICLEGDSHLPCRENGIAPEGEPIPDNKPDIKTTDNKPDIYMPKAQKHKYGEYKNVLLTDEELGKLQAEFPNYIELIDRLSGYVESTGKSYKSHYATIRNWVRKDQAEKKPKGAQEMDDFYSMVTDWANSREGDA